jgi:hypothetical protein
MAEPEALRRSGVNAQYVPGALMGVPVESQSPLAIGTPAKILDGPYVNSVPTYAGRLYDISPDGERVLMLKQTGARSQTGVTIVQN